MGGIGKLTKVELHARLMPELAAAANCGIGATTTKDF